MHFLQSDFIQSMMRKYSSDNTLTVHRVEPYSIDNSSSILVTLTSAGVEEPIGHYGLEITGEGASGPFHIDTVLKVKPHGKAVSSMLFGLSGAASEELAKVYGDFEESTGFYQTHHRELEIYEDLQPEVIPTIYGLAHEEGLFFILMEDLTSTDLLNSVMEPEAWSDSQMKNALSAMAKYHVSNLDFEVKVPLSHWSDTSSPDYMTSKSRLWSALWTHAHKALPEMISEERFKWMEEAIEDLPHWEGVKNRSQKTLVHNDCNPRNACVKDGSFCLYDWELATPHLPQYDAVEWLCFTLDADRWDRWEEYMEYYRQQLLANGWPGGTSENAKEEFYEGVQACLVDFGLHRLGMYLMAHSVSPYPFLPRVVDGYFNALVKRTYSVL